MDDLTLYQAALDLIHHDSIEQWEAVLNASAKLGCVTKHEYYELKEYAERIHLQFFDQSLTFMKINPTIKRLLRPYRNCEMGVVNRFIRKTKKCSGQIIRCRSPIRQDGALELAVPMYKKDGNMCFRE